MEGGGSPWAGVGVGLVFCTVGVLGLIFIRPLTRFFHDAGSGLFGPHVGDRVYTSRNLRWALIPAIVAGTILVTLGGIALLE
jgi:hypothetical protein